MIRLKQKGHVSRLHKNERYRLKFWLSVFQNITNQVASKLSLLKNTSLVSLSRDAPHLCSKNCVAGIEVWCLLDRAIHSIGLFLLVGQWNNVPPPPSSPYRVGLRAQANFSAPTFEPAHEARAGKHAALSVYLMGKFRGK